MESPTSRDKATYAGEAASKRSSSTSGLTNDQYILKQLKSINDSISSHIVVGTILTVDIGLGISVVEPPDWSRRGSAFDFPVKQYVYNIYTCQSFLFCYAHKQQGNQLNLCERN